MVKLEKLLLPNKCSVDKGIPQNVYLDMQPYIRLRHQHRWALHIYRHYITGGKEIKPAAPSSK